MNGAGLPIDPTLIVIIAALVQLLKPLLELAVPPEAPPHDGIIRLVAVLLGLGGVIVNYGAPATGPGWVQVIGVGIGTGLGAIGAYHAVSGSTETVTPPPEPPPARAVTSPVGR